MTSQRIGKYACLEVECKYLLNKIPDDLLDNPKGKGWLIADRYFPMQIVDEPKRWGPGEAQGAAHTGTPRTPRGGAYR